MYRRIAAALAGGAAILIPLIPATAAQADPAPPTITTPSFQLIGQGTPPFQSCTVVGVTAPETVSGIKGSPHADYTIRVFAVQSGIAQPMADSGPVITKAGNGVLQSLPIIRQPSFTNGGPVTFIADLVDSSGNIVATASSVNTSGC
jgi:hypothetical protein